MFTARITFDLAEVQAKLDAAGRDFVQEQHDVLHVIGVQLLSFVSLDYDTKSRGGTGTDGIAWKLLAASTIAKKTKRGKRNEKRKTTKSGKARPGAGSTAIGIDTGLQRASAQPGFSAAGGGNKFVVDATGVTVGFQRSYSGYFDEERPLLPTKLPEAWQRECDDILNRWGAKILERNLGKG